MARIVLPTAIVMAILAGCYGGPTLAPELGPAPSPPASTANGDPLAGDLPCDVAAVLAERCTSCHGAKLAGGAPNALLSVDDLARPSKSDPARSYAELSIARMQNADKPMPPNGAATADDTAVLQAWIDAGMPSGSCASHSPDSSQYDTPLTCTSETSWTRRNHGSSSMHPGVACIACHKRGEGPRYSFAGTVYPTAHEPDDCFGFGDGDATIEITGADGVTITLRPNGAGNFGTRKTVALPYTAKVIRGEKSREMLTPQRSGDCNACHSTDGNGADGSEKAPGRVMVP